jgi:hypothetical protein
LSHGCVTPIHLLIASRLHILKYKSNQLTPRIKTLNPLDIAKVLLIVVNKAKTGAVAVWTVLVPGNLGRGPDLRFPVTSVAHNAHRWGRKYQNALPK